MNTNTLSDVVHAATLRFAFGTALAASIALPLSAQEEDDDIFVLSPFDVSADEGGYRSTQTMAGTRLRTQIADTPASLSILTEDFLDELGATDIESIADFLPSTENFAMIGIDTAGNAIKSGNNLSVRGFHSNTRTRNFFRTEASTDRYLTDRITAARGPNSLLFGIGNPGGSVLIGTKRAHMSRNKGEFEVQYDDTRDGGYRAVVDQNLVLVDERLAFRVAAVDQKLDGFRDPEETEMSGLFLTSTWLPFESGKSVFRFNYENEERRRIVARPWAPYDYFSNWTDQGAPLYDNLNDSRPGANPSKTNPFVRWENRIVNITGQEDIHAFRTARGKGYNGYVVTSAPIVNGIQEQNISLTEDFKALNPLDVLSRHFEGDGDPSTNLETWLAGLGEARSIPEAFADQELVIPMETWFAGDLDTYTSDVDAFSAFFEQQIGDNLFIEIAGNKEDTGSTNTVMLRNNEYAISYDPNLYLPDGSPNPYAGMPFVGGLANPTDTTSSLDSEEVRITATYNLDLSDKKLFERFGLGRHQLSALANRYERDFLTVQKRPVVYEWNGQLVSDSISSARGVNHNNAKLGGRYYLSPGKDPYVPEFWTPMKGEGVAGKSDWADLQYFSDNTVIDSYAFGSQSFFFNNRLVLTGGIREDILNVDQGIKVRFTKENQDSANGDHFGELDVPTSRITIDSPEEQSWRNESYGGVFHLIHGRNEGILNTLSVFYNAATNVSASPERLNIRFEPLSPQNGEGADFGIKFDLFGSKLTGTITKFETTMINDFRNSALGIFSRSGMGGFGPVSEVADPARADRVEASSIAWAPIFDSTTSGTELEFVWNPTKNFRLRGTYSNFENVPTRFGEDIAEYYAELRPAAQAFVDANFDADFPGAVDPDNPTEAESRIILADDVKTAIGELDVNVPLKLAFNGVPTAGLPKHKGSLSANYSFARDSALKGLSFGATFVYRSSVPIAFETNDVLEADLSNALIADSQKNVGLNVSYRRKIFNDRFNWRVQLNVKNLLDNTDPLWLDGIWDRDTDTFVRNRNKMVAPRSFTLTNSVSW